MTYNEMTGFFDILQDKFGSPYHTDDEKALFLNRAQIDYVTAFLPIEGDKLNIELNANTIARIHPLIFDATSPMAVTTGFVSKATVQALVSTPIMRLLSVSYNGLPVAATRHNNWFVYLNNTFKAPTATRPRMKEDGAVWVFRPVDITATIVFYGVREPVTLLSDGSVDCELPEIAHNEIVAMALNYASVGSRDQMLAELNTRTSS